MLPALRTTCSASEAAAALLTEGTKSRTARRIAEQSAEIGGALGAGSSPDSLIVQGNALAEHTAALLDLVADITLNASFPERWNNIAGLVRKTLTFNASALPFDRAADASNSARFLGSTPISRY